VITVLFLIDTLFDQKSNLIGRHTRCGNQ